MQYDVLLATYNGAKYIVEQLESIVGQTVKPTNILIRDDGSTDDTVEVINNYIFSVARDINIQLIVDSNNVGYIKNFELLSSRAVSDIVFFSDQDDIWLYNKAQLIVDKFIDQPHTDVVFSDAKLINDNKNKLGTLWEHVGYRKNIGKITLENILLKNVVTGATMAVRRSFLKRLLPFPESVPHDHWIATNAVINESLDFIDNQLILYRQHSNNQIGAKKSSLYNKIIMFANVSKMSKRIGYYRQIFKLLEALNGKEYYLNSNQEFINIKKYIHNMNCIYKGHIIDINQDIRLQAFFPMILFKPSYLRYKRIKTLSTDFMDGIYLRTIYKKYNVSKNNEKINAGL